MRLFIPLIALCLFSYSAIAGQGQYEVKNKSKKIIKFNGPFAGNKQVIIIPGHTIAVRYSTPNTKLVFRGDVSLAEMVKTNKDKKKEYIPCHTKMGGYTVNTDKEKLIKLVIEADTRINKCTVDIQR